MIHIGLCLAVLLKKCQNRRHNLDWLKLRDANRPSIYDIILRSIILSSLFRLNLAIPLENSESGFLPHRIRIDKNKRCVRKLPGMHESLEQQIMLQRIDP